MKRTQRIFFTLSLLTGGFAVLAIWSGTRMMAAARAAAAAKDDTRQCQALAERIHRLQNKPSIVGQEEVDPNELNHRLEQAAAKTHLPAGSLISIRPRTAKRLETSVYRQKPTDLTLRGVTLMQLVDFLRALMSDDPQLQIHSLRLTAPRQESSAQQRTETWSAELTISYLIYAPPTSPKAGQAKGMLP